MERINGISGSLAEREQTALSWGDGVIGERGNSFDEGKGAVALGTGPPPCAQPWSKTCFGFYFTSTGVVPKSLLPLYSKRAYHPDCPSSQRACFQLFYEVKHAVMSSCGGTRSLH